MSSDEMNRDMFEICHTGRVMPIQTIDDAEVAVPLAQALYAGGVKVMEIPVRTPAALEGIRLIRSEVPDMIIGAGTLLTPKDVQDAHDVGAQFGVSPGFTDALLSHVEDLGMPFLPAVATPSEMMQLMERDFVVQKFFPAEVNGGVEMLRAVFGPLPEISFLATGGIKQDAVSSYLELVNVLCVGGSWVAPAGMIKEQNWRGITELAKKASEY